MNKIAMATKHQKSKLLNALFNNEGYHIFETQAFDTDQLGTFSGTVTRTLSAKECALEKAKQACLHTGSDWGLGNEGSFGGGPLPGIMQWQHEILCLYNQTSGQIIFGQSQGPVQLPTFVDDTPSAITAFLQSDPEQGWCIKSDETAKIGLTPEQVIELLAEHPTISHSDIVPDLRAHKCPARHAMIVRAGENLLENLKALCPKCRAPNFVIKQFGEPKPCRDCGQPSSQKGNAILQCDQCQYQLADAESQGTADPYYCQFCNP